jgi:hypothetical protein
MRRLLISFVIPFLSACSLSSDAISNESYSSTSIDREYNNSNTYPSTAFEYKTTQTTKIILSPTINNIPTSTYSSTSVFDTPKPYLAYWVKTLEDRQAITIFNADTMVRKIIPVPEGVSNVYLENSLSPNGEWLAFYTGSAGKEVWGNSYLPDYDMSGPFDLTLKLLHLSDMQVFTITKLLSPDYPNNFDNIVRYLLKNDSDYQGADYEEIKKVIIGLFLCGIKGLDWSPDSGFIAFSGEMDGPTSDLYIYNMKKNDILRLTDGSGQMAGGINWSSDGRWILHVSTNQAQGIEWTPEIFAARADGSGAKSITYSMSAGKWISKDKAIFYEAANGPGIYDLRMINIETGYKSSIWEDSFESYAISPDDSIAIVCAYNGFYDPNIQPGTFLVVPGKPVQLIISDPYCWDLVYRGPYSHKFVIGSGNDGLLGISKNNEITMILEDKGSVYVSPDYRWMVLVLDSETQNASSMKLFDQEDQYVRELGAYTPDYLIWRPDSKGLFFVIENRLYYLSIPDGKPVLVDENFELCYEGGGCYRDFDYQWIW